MDDINPRLAQIVFENLPIAMCVLQYRVITECNQPFADLFAGKREDFVGQSIRIIFPSEQEYEGLGEKVYNALKFHPIYHDERMMRSLNGRVFWCYARGKTLSCEQPQHMSVWTWGAMHSPSELVQSLSARERELVPLLSEGLSSKEIARQLNLSFRTVEMHRARLLKKAGVNSTANLLKLLAS